MGFRALLGVMAFIAGAGSAAADDDMAGKLCPILESIAADPKPQANYAVQSALIFQVAGAYEENPEQLGSVMRKADEATTGKCPEARAKVLEKIGVSSLFEAMR